MCGQSEPHVADWGTRVEPVLSRRVVLVPGSQDDTPRSIQDRSCASNRFSVLTEPDAEDGQPQHHDIGTPPPTADERVWWGSHRHGRDHAAQSSHSQQGRMNFRAPWTGPSAMRTMIGCRPEVQVVGNESDTDSMEFEVEGSMASGDEEEVVPSLEFVMPNVERGAVQLASQRLDSVNLRDEFRTRASVMKTVPGFLQGPFRQTMHVALEEICVGLDWSDNVRQERGWKLLMLLPRLLLHRPARGGLIAKDTLSRRFEDFVHGRWSHLIDDGRRCAEQSSKAATRKRRRGQQDDVERRTES